MSLAQTFARTGFARFVNSPTGRALRIIVGVGLLVWGYTLRASVSGIVLMVVALVPLLAGSFDLCLISALLGGPFKGAAVRNLSGAA